jgi:hypothetical protein
MVNFFKWCVCSLIAFSGYSKRGPRSPKIKNPKLYQQPQQHQGKVWSDK